MIDIACLCQDPNYVSTLSCCLATQCNSNEQASISNPLLRGTRSSLNTAAIEFNQQECSNVNESAPNFVGCAPSNLASSYFLAPTTAPTTLATSTTNSLISAISGIVESELATLNGSKVTASFDGRPLLTGSCNQPYFAAVTKAPGQTTEFPQIGCGPNQGGCCAFPYGANAVITRCPQDHFTIAGACCPV